MTKSYLYRTWQMEEQYFAFSEVLNERGWKYIGPPIDPSVKSGINDDEILLFLCQEEDVNVISAIMQPSNYILPSYLGTETACSKCEFAKSLKNTQFYPETFIFPDDRKRFCASSKDEYWIYKPTQGSCGKNVEIHSSKSKTFRNLVKRKAHFIIQRYITNPFLLGGYKFHVRIFVLITSINPLKAFLHSDGQVLFSVVKYKNPSEENSKYIHLTNWAIQNERKNIQNVLEEKDFIGIGCEWTYKKLCNFLQQHPMDGVSVDSWNEQLRMISRKTAEAVSQHPSVVKCSSRLSMKNHYELFGLDVMLDDNGKWWLMEVNNSPGLQPSPEIIKFGQKEVLNTCAVENNRETKLVIHDLLSFLSFDNYKTGNPDNFLQL